MEKLKILVSGATGMLGLHAVKRLLSSGHRVFALLRKTSDEKILSQLLDQYKDNLSIVRAELSDLTALAKVMHSMDAVIHAAGIVDPHASRSEIYSVNVDGTKNMLAASELAQVKHFIHISSLSVITGQTDIHAANESAPLIYCGEAYADSKIDAEKAVNMYFGRSAMMVSILRPGFIYGPGEKAWMPRLIENLRTGRAMLIDGGIKQTNVIYIENCISAIELALMNKSSDKQVFNLTDGETVTKKELFDVICDEMGFSRIKREIPGWLAKIVCEFVSNIAPYLSQESRKKMSRFSRAAFRLAGLNQGFDISKAEKVLNYTDRIPFGLGMRETLQAFKIETKETVLQAKKEEAFR